MSKYTKEDIIRLVKDGDVEFIRMQFTDIFGQLKNVAITASQIEKAVNNEIMIDGSSIEGFVRINESDQYLRPDLDTFAILPWRPQHGKVARLICDVYNPDGTPFTGDPRGTLKRILKKAADMGYSFNVGPEMEFFLFQTDEQGRPTTTTSDEAGYFDLGPLDHGESTRREICMALEQMGFEIEASHHEVAAGQHEIDFKYADALTAADNIMTFKLAVKTLAQKNGLHATFMPKPVFGINGSGMHTNMSLFKDGKNVFADPSDSRGLSKEAYSFIAGILAHVRGMAAITNPLVNSYKRLVPGAGAGLRGPLLPGLERQQPKRADPHSRVPGHGHPRGAALPRPQLQPLPEHGGLPGGGPGRHREGPDPAGGDHREHLRHGRRHPRGQGHREPAGHAARGGEVPEGRRSHLRGAGRARAFPVRPGQGKGMGRLPDARERVGDRKVFGDVLTNTDLSLRENQYLRG